MSSEKLIKLKNKRKNLLVLLCCLKEFVVCCRLWENSEKYEFFSGENAKKT